METEDKYYRAPLGAGTLIITIFAIILISFTIYLTLATATYIAAFYTPIIILILLISYLPVPDGYYLSKEGIVISRRIHDISIPYDTISDIEYKHNRILFSFFSVGNRGWFGWACSAYYIRYGWVKIYSRKISNIVLIYTKSGGNYALAPENPEDFVSDIKSKIKITGKDHYRDLSVEQRIEGEMRYLGFIEEKKEEPEFAEVIDF